MIYEVMVLFYSRERDKETIHIPADDPVQALFTATHRMSLWKADKRGDVIGVMVNGPRHTATVVPLPIERPRPAA